MSREIIFGLDILLLFVAMGVGVALFLLLLESDHMTHFESPPIHEKPSDGLVCLVGLWCLLVVFACAYVLADSVLSAGGWLTVRCILR